MIIVYNITCISLLDEKMLLGCTWQEGFIFLAGMSGNGAEFALQVTNGIIWIFEYWLHIGVYKTSQDS